MKDVGVSSRSPSVALGVGLTASDPYLTSQARAGGVISLLALSLLIDRTPKAHVHERAAHPMSDDEHGAWEFDVTVEGVSSKWPRGGRPRMQKHE
jgi:hypothetical protein